MRLTTTAACRAELAVFVEKVFIEFRQRYGCRLIAREFNASGLACSNGQVAELMRGRGLMPVQPRAYRVTTVPGVGNEHPANLI